MIRLLKDMNGRVVADTGCNIVTFNGTPYSYQKWHNDYEQVGEAPSVSEWQADPGKFGPHYAVAQVWPITGEPFYMGGSWLYIKVWADEHGAVITPNVAIYADRNVARQVAERRGGVTV